MNALTEHLRELARALEAVAETLEAEGDRGGRNPRRAEQLHGARLAHTARAVVEPAYRRRMFTDPERLFGRADDGFERVARRVRELDEAWTRIEDGAELGDRDLP